MKSTLSSRIDGRFATQNVHDRLLSLAEPVTESGCWIWNSFCNSKGYGRIWLDGKPRPAHRVSYQHFIGPIEEGMTIDHLCRVRCCINPQHLEAVTSRVNTLRGIGVTSINNKKTHCNHGHEFSEANTYHLGGNMNWRECRACRKSRSANRRSNRQ